MAAPYTPDPTVKARAVETTRAEAIERLAHVARLRDQLAQLDAEIETQERAFFASLVPLTDRQHDTKAQLTIAEQEARALALDLYHADPTNNRPVAGASIKVRRGVEYRREDAERWTAEKGLFRIPETVDTKALEKFLLANESPLGLAYTVTETPTVALDSTLPLTPEPIA
jgi:hypothetical protein